MSPNHVGATRTSFLQSLAEANCQFSNAFYCFEILLVWHIINCMCFKSPDRGFHQQPQADSEDNESCMVGISTKGLWLQKNKSNPKVQNVHSLMTRQSKQVTIVTVSCYQEEETCSAASLVSDSSSSLFEKQMKQEKNLYIKICI